MQSVSAPVFPYSACRVTLPFVLFRVYSHHRSPPLFINLFIYLLFVVKTDDEIDIIIPFFMYPTCIWNLNCSSLVETTIVEWEFWISKHFSVSVS